MENGRWPKVRQRFLAELLLICKTRANKFTEIEAAVDDLHSYDVPPVLMISIDQAKSSYLDWIDTITLFSVDRSPVAEVD